MSFSAWQANNAARAKVDLYKFVILHEAVHGPARTKFWPTEQYPRCVVQFCDLPLTALPQRATYGAAKRHRKGHRQPAVYGHITPSRYSLTLRARSRQLSQF